MRANGRRKWVRFPAVRRGNHFAAGTFNRTTFPIRTTHRFRRAPSAWPSQPSFAAQRSTARPAGRAESAAGWAKRGADAEVREDYDAAFEAYRQAHLLKPKDLRYQTKFERVRFAAAAAHVDRGRVLRQSGDLNGALSEFQRALSIDGGNQTAQQEITITTREMSTAPGAAMQRETPLGPSAAVIGVAEPLQLKTTSNDPITYHAVADTKDIYTALGKTAGINVIFDPEYTSRRLQFDVVNASLADALRILGVQAGTFYKTITPNTIFVAANTPTKRNDLNSQAVQTFYLSNAATQADQNELLTALRNVLDPTAKIFLVPSQNAIVMRATPDQLLLTETLLNNLDRAKSEVVVDVAVLEVNRDKARNLGITLPQQISVTPQVSASDHDIHLGQHAPLAARPAPTAPAQHQHLLQLHRRQPCREHRFGHRQRAVE